MQRGGAIGLSGVHIGLAADVRIFAEPGSVDLIEYAASARCDDDVATLFLRSGARRFHRVLNVDGTAAGDHVARLHAWPTRAKVLCLGDGLDVFDAEERRIVAAGGFGAVARVTAKRGDGFGAHGRGAEFAFDIPCYLRA